MMERIKKNLWNVLCESNSYSFKDNPLPVFNLLALFYIGKHDSLDNIPTKWLGLLKIDSSLPETTSKEVISILKLDIDNDIEKLRELTEYLVGKYISLLQEEKTPILSSNLENFIYWFATGYEANTCELAIYNPFARFASFGKEHVCGLNFQMGDETNGIKSQEIIKDYRNSYFDIPKYYGYEANPILSYIANVRLLVHSPINKENVFVYSESTSLSNMDDFSGGWTLMTVPPVNFYSNPSDEDIELMTIMMYDFIKADGMEHAFLVLPKSFCYSQMYYSVRRTLINRGLLNTVVELPSELFKSKTEAVLVYLSKSSNDRRTNMVDAKTLVENGELNSSIMFDICLFDEPSDYNKVIDDYTFAQCDYCILPSIYLNPHSVVSNNRPLEEAKAKYIALTEEKVRSENKRIAHRSISKDLSHMLGGVYQNINICLDELENIQGAKEMQEVLKDNLNYMRRLINTIDKDFSEISDFKEVEVNTFFNTFCRGWANYGAKNSFNLSYKSGVDDETTFRINDTFMKALFDAIMENAYKHGFNNINISSPKVEIETSYTKFNNSEYIRITVSNNGSPFPEGFGIENYIKEGEFGGPRGNTGRGGYHVYQITKAHKGFLDIKSNEYWNAIIEILLPVEYFEESEIGKFKEYGEQHYL